MTEHRPHHWMIEPGLTNVRGVCKCGAIRTFNPPRYGEDTWAANAAGTVQADPMRTAASRKRGGARGHLGAK